ncbi:MAG: gliding motility-associated C-terminal domain-containing protein [Bacteroidales bacterium]|nr:gliding motility-associated C-terminal domain-containing protein [Candidatus Scybalocola fimicaballi]
MKRFLQILERFVSNKGYEFEKYLVAFCMLIGVQISAFAQYNFLEAPAGSTMIRAGIVHVNPGDDITLKVPFAAPGTPVKWEYRLKRDDPRSLMDSETDVNLDLTNIQQDGEYIATVNVFGVPTTYRMIVSCATIYTNTTSACPNTPVQLTVKGGQFSDNGKYERKEGPGWRTFQKSEFAYNTFKDEWIVQADREFSARASFDYGYYSNDIATYKTNSVDVSLLTDCKAECLQTSTGEYYVGTDFDPNKETANKIPQDIVNHFGDYHIELKEADLKDYWLGTNTEKFFGKEQIPFKDQQTGVEGKNNYMFLQDANARVCELWFYPVSEFVGKTYKYKMRIYLQKEKGCQIDPNAKFKARTGQGKQTTDRLEGAAYWNKNGELIKKAVGYEEGDMTLSFAQLIDQSEVKDYDMIMVDIVFDGKFPDSPNGLSSFKFMPEFAQMGCWKVAIDYISAEIENVCLSPQVLCAGEYTTAHAAGYPDDSEFKWFKKVGDKWVEDKSNYDKPDAKIQAEKGLTTYKLEVDIPNVGLRTQEFTVSGNDCMINRPSQIVGGTFCFSNVDTKTVKRYFPNVVDGSKDLSFEWAMYKPDNSVWFDSKKHADSHFKVLTSDEFKEDPSSENYNPNKNDVLEMTLDLADTAEIKEGDYKLEMRLMKTVGSTVSLDTVMDTIVHIYRTPDITLKLTGERFNEISLEDNKTICPSDIHREVIANAQNGFASPYSSSYIYTWSSLPGNEGVFTPNSEDPTKATINLSKIPEICSGNLDSVQFSVKVEIDGCAGIDKNKYGVEKPVDPTIDCSSLIGKKDTIDVPMGKEVATFQIPFPDFTSGCDSVPELTVVITPNRPEIKDTLVIDTIKVLKNEIGIAKVLTVTLPWDTYDFHYTVTDGCGKKDECHANIVVIKRYGPDVACDSILDLDEINGDFNDATSSKCNAIFDAVNIPIPVLMDRNDERGTKITGEYAGRRHFLHQQDKDVLKATAEERSKFDTTIELYDEYEMEYSYILWKFTNDAGNSSYCVQEVLVRDTAKPEFNCDDIVPNPFRPVTEKGKCSIEFKEFVSELISKNYYARVDCPLPGHTVPGELFMDSLKKEVISETREFSVGIVDTIYWQFREPHDYGDNVKTCPQYINAKSGDSVDVDCDALAYFEALAEAGTCFVNAAEVKFPRPPYGAEPCLDKNGDSIKVPGVGTRSDGLDLEADYPTGDTYITWIFEGENSFPSTCKTHIMVLGNKKPEVDCALLFPKKYYDMPDCDSMLITLEPQEVADPCVNGYMMKSEPWLTKYVRNKEDNTKIDTIYTKITENPLKFPIGESFVSWIFWDYTHNVSDTCVQSIHLRDTFPPEVDCDTLKDSYVTLHGECSLPYTDLRDSLGRKAAIEHCTRDTIWGEPYLLDTLTGKRREFPATVTVGIYPIQWVFANDSLTTKESTCDKTLYLKHDMGTPFNCETLKSPLQLLDTKGLCKVPLDPDVLPIPHAQDPCVVDFTVYAHGYVQLFEEGDFVELCYYDSTLNKEVYLFDLPLGGHKVKWRFENKYSTKVDSCEQIVKANNDIIDRINCNDLADYVHYTMRTAGEGATFQQVVDSGLIVPNYDDPCGVLDTIYTRNDNKSIYDIYPVSKLTYITWTFRDTTKNAVREKVCHTTVEVSNGATPTMLCPDLPGKFACLEAVPAPISTFEQFVALGGKLISNGVDVTEYAVPSTFKCDTFSLGDKCDYTFIRKYSVRNQRDSLSECEQRIPIKDTVPPVWMDNASSLSKVFDCEYEDFFPTDLRANDECSNRIFAEYLKVNTFDGEFNDKTNKTENLVDGLFYTISSTRSNDPSDCDYYNYKTTYKYVAVDRCHNYSDVLSFEAQVQDTFAPVLNVPQGWRDSLVVAEYTKPCLFLVPDLTSSLPSGSISDVCDPNAVNYYKITQKPAAGSEFNPNLGNQYITLYITDPCGLYDTLMHEVYVPSRKDVVSQTLIDTTICAESGITLENKLLSSTKSKVWRKNPFNREWGFDTVPKVSYDYYRGEASRENLIYSNNKTTYADEFDSRNKFDSLVLNRLDKSGLYTIVVMDTTSLCFDTASGNITVHSGPSVFVDAASIYVCEYDSIHLVSEDESLFEKYNVYIIDNGEDVCDTCQGWLLDGKKYIPGSLLDYTNSSLRLQYYATNKCATYHSSDWISVNMKQRMSSDNFMLTTEPNNPPRVYIGESAKLSLVTKYTPDTYLWFRVKGTVDGTYDEMFDKYGHIRPEYVNPNFEPDSLFDVTYYGEPNYKVRELTELGDSAQYYVLMVDSICPAVPSNIVSVDVVTKLPTAFTPQNSIGMNDVFMEGHKVIIFNRYGQKMIESDNGWDGTCRGALVDPGVYFYEVVINGGDKYKGTIEVVYFK